ncbi:MAG TPA: ABC transporter ATP-binding protein, partial [Chloroflexota bacterium]
NLGFASQRVGELVDQALDLVGLADRAADEPYALTLSERKLLCIASVVAMDTPVLVLDEPTTGQDQRGVRRMAELVRHLRSTGRSVIAITHDMEFVAEGFERTVVMAHGQVVLDADTRTVFGEVDLLETCGVEPPPITRLARLLGLRQTPLLIPEFVAAFAEGVGSHV